MAALALADDPRLREEMAQERRLLNAKVAEADADKAKAASLEATLNKTQGALLATQARDSQQLQGLAQQLSAEKLRDGNLTELLAQARATQAREVQRLEQELIAANATYQKEEQRYQAQVGQLNKQEAAEKNSNADRIQKIKDVLRDALSVPVLVPSPFARESNATGAKLTLAQNGTSATVADTVDDTLERTATTVSHQDRVLNWAFRKLTSEGNQLQALNVSKAASERKSDVLEQELADAQESVNTTQKTLDETRAELSQAQAGDAKDRRDAQRSLEQASAELQQVHGLVAKAASD